MPHPYNEDQLCEQPAIALFAELGWHTASALEELFGPTGTLLRETPAEEWRLPYISPKAAVSPGGETEQFSEKYGVRFPRRSRNRVILRDIQA